MNTPNELQQVMEENKKLKLELEKVLILLSKQSLKDSSPEY